MNIRPSCPPPKIPIFILILIFFNLLDGIAEAISFFTFFYFLDLFFLHKVHKVFWLNSMFLSSQRRKTYQRFNSKLILLFTIIFSSCINNVLDFPFVIRFYQLKRIDTAMRELTFVIKFIKCPNRSQISIN